MGNTKGSSHSSLQGMEKWDFRMGTSKRNVQNKARHPAQNTEKKEGVMKCSYCQEKQHSINESKECQQLNVGFRCLKGKHMM